MKILFINDEKKIMQNNSEVEFFISCASVLDENRKALEEGTKIFVTTG